MAEEGIELRRFSFVPGGQEYYCATDVARFMGRPLWQFYQLHPSLYRRQATAVERQLLQYWDVAHAPLVTLLLAEEVDVLRAEDDGAPLLRQPRPVKSRKIMLGSTPVLLTQSAHAPMIPPRAPGTERAVKGSSNPLRQYYRKPHGLASEADALEEQLVPIKLTLDKEGYKFRDQFTWNINEPHITPALFAELLCQDAELPSRFAGTFAHSIQQQLDAFRQTQMMDVSTRSALVRVEVQYASSLLSDSFEWQHGAGSPEDFAQSLIIELGLPSDYGPLLAHAIHEQLLADKKAVVYDDAPKPIVHAGGLDCSNCFRSGDLEPWSPSILTLTQEELDKKEVSEDRDGRRRRRGGRNKDEDDGHRRRSHKHALAMDQAFHPEVPEPQEWKPAMRIAVYLAERGTLSDNNKAITYPSLQS